MKKLLSLFIFASILLVLAACGGKETTDTPATEEASADKLSIYTTVYPLQYFAERIGGDFVEAQSIYPAGANEHTFEPTQKDMMALADADYFFYIGLGLEGFVEKAKTTLANEDVTLVPVAESVTEEQLHISTGHTHAEAVEAHEEDEHEGHNHEAHEEDEHEGHNHEAHEEHAAADEHEGHNHSDHDAHVWLSPVISKDLALTIKNELAKALPEQDAYFTENYNALAAELDALHNDFTTMAEGVNAKTFFVSHAAFGYIAGHYGLTQVPVAGLNSQSEPSQKELTTIVDLAKKENIQYIFFEQNVSSNLASVIQKEVGADTLILHNLSVLTPDDVKNNENYFTLMRKNIDVLKQALTK
ncbi:MAG: zinc ABC transporter substrate-binding protein [Solibacillus sp.]